ncbi:hypothetical protein BST97_10030 [Nonlabens spongiae]|uniref:Uncharacterized protein n=1 Tax=Nonlabens spongiae TaxID=331648 RepID=A0A1W6MLF6_9FLAO|nr:hypothetical protein [Nonlabens spongiae]ARN78299.1 hypothetical protein BST97_10030 [Nonlabens spongiae]
MSPKVRVFLIYGISFLAIFLIVRFITVQFVEESIWTTIIPIGASMIFSPKPHVEQSQSGKEYGLKSIFSKKIIRF